MDTTTPTPGSSSPAPSTVIGEHLAASDVAGALRHAIRGHEAIVAAIVNHAEEDAARREARRAGGGRGTVLRG